MTGHRPAARTEEIDLPRLCAHRALPRRAGPDRPDAPADRPLVALARVKYGPVPLDFEQLAARTPAVQWGLTLAGEADLELHLACVDQQELREVVAGLRRAGAAGVQVELVLRRLVPGAVPPSSATMARSAVA